MEEAPNEKPVSRFRLSERARINATPRPPRPTTIRPITEPPEKATENAQAAPFIGDLPEKFSEHLNAKGTNLSGGQRQRLLISRALAGHPDILVLDDSSSALDYRTDANLRMALGRNYDDVTTIMIASRVSSIANCTEIIVLDEGKVIGQGTHEELLKTCDTYREIAETQMGGM